MLGLRGVEAHMSLVYRCDRCDGDRPSFVRGLTVTYLGTGATISDPEITEYHLCGYCWSQVRNVINGDEVAP